MITLISPYNNTFSSVKDLPLYQSKSYTVKPFDDITIQFLDKFSKKILLNKSINHLPEIAALGFWLRRSNIEVLKIKNDYLLHNSNATISPIGKVLHVCPANVDTIFMYSMVVSLLMGNKNILKVSSRVEAPSILQLFVFLNELMHKDEFAILTSYINIIKYDHNDDISNDLSSSVNARLIWGGDNTIKTFKKFATHPRCKDIVFADRISMQMIDSKAFLNLNEIEQKLFAKNFFNDCYTFDQMGCSSPQTIVFIGTIEEYKLAQICLTNLLDKHLVEHYNNDLSSLASLKLNRLVDDTLDELITTQTGSNYIKIASLKPAVDFTNIHSCGAGYFYSTNYNLIENIQPFNNPKVQTISYFGLNETQINHLKNIANGESIDRIVPLGKALDFNYIWDGYNLFDELSKKVQIILN